MVDEVSLTIATASLGAAAAAVVVAVLPWRESRKQRHLAEEHRKLTGVMVESLGYLAKSTKPPSTRHGTASPLVVTQPSTTTPQSAAAQAPLAETAPLTPTQRMPTPAQQVRLALAAQQEERRRLGLQLRQQQQQWKQQKDIAKAIGWVLNQIGSDDDDEKEEE